MMQSMLIHNLSKCVAASLFAAPALLAQENPDAVANKLLGGDKDAAASAATAAQVGKNEAIYKEHYRLKAIFEMAEGDDASKSGDYKKAAAKYRAAIQNFKLVSNNSPEILAQVQAANQKIAEAQSVLAMKLEASAREQTSTQLFDEAVDSLKLAIEADSTRKHDFDARIAKLQTMAEKTRMVESVNAKGYKEEEVKRTRKANVNIDQAKILYSDRRFMDAKEVAEQVLVEDPYNVEATQIISRCNLRVSESGRLRRESVVAERVAEVEWKWSLPIPASSTSVTTNLNANKNAIPVNNDSASINDKFKNIIIPKVKYENLTIEEVIEKVKRAAREQDPDKKGINIILSLKSTTPAPSTETAVAAPDAFPAGPAIPVAPVDLNAAPVAVDGTPLADPAAPVPVEEGHLINLELDNIPVGELIRYICQNAGLKYKIDGNLVKIASADVQILDMETKFFPVPAGFLDLVTRTHADGGGLGDGGPAAGPAAVPDATGAAPEGDAVRQHFVDFGVKFDTGANVTFIQSVNQLVVTNTAEELRKVEQIINQLTPTAQQVVIESKFVEIAQNELEELGFQWDINAVNDGDTINGTVTSAAGSTIQSPAFAGRGAGDVTIDRNYNANSSGKSSLSKVLGSGVHFDRTGDLTSATANDGLGSSVRNLNSVLSATSVGGDSGYSPAALGFSVVLGDYTMKALVRALDQRDNKDVLNAPKVTAQSGQTAIIRVVQERYFPTEWEKPTVDVAAGGNNGGAATQSIKPSKPTFGEPTDIGVVMTVTPTIDPDGYSIDLEIKPQVKEFLFYDTRFNSDIFVAGVGGITAHFEMPVFETRSIETKVKLWDGETLALGGMVRDNTVTYEDKIPYLGDIPYLGFLFSSKGSRTLKRNLLIFVTSRIITPAGIPVRPNNIRGLPDFKRL